MVGVSFAQRGTYGGIQWTLSMESYARLADPLIGMIFLRSILFASLTTLCCAILAFPLAYYMARVSRRWQLILFILIMIPFWTNFLVRTYAWVVIFRGDGIINTVVKTLGFVSEPLPLLFSNFSVMVGLVYGYLPFMVLPLVVAIERINPAFEEAAQDLYASMARRFWHVVVPLAKPGWVAGSILVFIPSLGAFITPYLLGGGQKLMVGTLIQQEILVARDWPFGAAVSLSLMAMVIGLWWVQIKREMRRKR